MCRGAQISKKHQLNNNTQMKNYSQSEIKQAQKMAFSFLYSINNIVLNRAFKFDKRTRIGNYANTIVKCAQIDKQSVLNIKKQRVSNKLNLFSNILTNPLVLDYRQNKRNIKQVHPDRIEFYGRNHWAKNQTDLKVLSTLCNKQI